MATLRDLESANLLFRVDPQLDPLRQEERLIHIDGRVKQWIEQALPSAESVWPIETSPLEQLAILMETFCSGEPLEVGRGFHILHPPRHGVWELKTPDLRLFGWFHRRDCFIAGAIDLADRIKQFNLYAGYVNQTVRLRASLQLDPPEFIASSNPNDVVSNYHFP